MPRVDIERIHAWLDFALRCSPPALAIRTDRLVPLPIVLNRVPKLLCSATLQPAAPTAYRLDSLLIATKNIIQVCEDEDLHKPKTCDRGIVLSKRICWVHLAVRVRGVMVREGVFEELCAEFEVI